MGDLPGPGNKPTSSALVGRFLTTGPSGKSQGWSKYYDFKREIALASLHFTSQLLYFAEFCLLNKTSLQTSRSVSIRSHSVCQSLKFISQFLFPQYSVEKILFFVLGHWRINFILQSWGFLFYFSALSFPLLPLPHSLSSPFLLPLSSHWMLPRLNYHSAPFWKDIF